MCYILFAAGGQCRRGQGVRVSRGGAAAESTSGERRVENGCTVCWWYYYNMQWISNTTIFFSMTPLMLPLGSTT